MVFASVGAWSWTLKIGVPSWADDCIISTALSRLWALLLVTRLGSGAGDLFLRWRLSKLGHFDLHGEGELFLKGPFLRKRQVKERQTAIAVQLVWAAGSSERKIRIVVTEENVSLQYGVSAIYSFIIILS